MARTYRRKMLDQLLERSRSMMTGTVIDLGGKRTDARGEFRPDESEGSRWIFVNLDESTNPDIRSDIAAVTADSESADCVICTETLQHVESPQAVIREAFRLLKPGGVFIASTPFLYPVHRDPADNWRFGPDGLRLLFSVFADVQVFEMGNTPGVLGLFIERRSAAVALPAPIRKPVKLFARAISAMLFWMDSGIRLIDGKERPFTTGYFVTAVKPGP